MNEYYLNKNERLMNLLNNINDKIESIKNNELKKC